MVLHVRRKKPVYATSSMYRVSAEGLFDDALLNCAVGERIIYHIGEHCAGAHRVAARKAYEKGLVTLSLKKACEEPV